MRRTRRRRWVLGAALLLVGGTATTLAPRVIAAGAPAACATTDPGGGDWATYSHDYSNTRNQDQEHTIMSTAAATLAPAWTFSAAANGGGGSFSGTPVVSGGCVYVASDAGNVYALNADTGAVVWSHKLTPSTASVNGTLAVDAAAGLVFANVSNAPNPPFTIALHTADGTPAWQTTVDTQPGSDLYSSPVVYKGVVFVGVSAGAAEVGDASGTKDRYAFQGSFVLLDETAGTVLKKTWTVHPPPNAPSDTMAGASVWSTPAIDPATDRAYVGTGNPFQPYSEPTNANSIIAVDVNPSSTTFGDIVGHYKGNPDTYAASVDKLPCVVLPSNGRYPTGAGSCGDLDLDFGAAPNLFPGPGGTLRVGDGQKSGVYHAVNTADMSGAWQSTLGAPSSVGGIVGTAAAADGNIVGPMTVPGYLWSVSQATGNVNWVTPTADAVHWGEAVSTANGVAYTVDTKGFLDAYDAKTGVPVLHRPIQLGSNVNTVVANLGGGVAIARHMVYAPGGGFIVAFKPSASVPAVPVPPLPGPPGPPGAPGTGNVVAAVPGSFAATYATPVTVITKGGTLTFANLDAASHDVVDDGGKFASPLIGLGQTAGVGGVSSLPAGQYHYRCSIHPNMTGTLVVVG